MNEQIQTEYKKILADLTRYAKAYYAEGKFLISDYEYDQLYKRLENIEKKYPQLVAAESPTQHIGSDLQPGAFGKVRHVVPMQSLDNTYTDGDVSAFTVRIQNELSVPELEWSLEPKVDGISVNVRYEKGIFVRASTRGDGKIGDDITENVKQIKNIPLEIKGDVPDVLEVCGEIYMSFETFERLNNQRQEQGIDPFANPRNAVAGSIKQLDSKQVKQRGLEVIFYGLGEYSTSKIGNGKIPVLLQLPDNQSDLIRWFRQIGVPTFDLTYRCMTSGALLNAIEDLDKERKKLPYETDGAVIKLSYFEYRPLLGSTDKSPRWAIAYKYKPEQAVTKLKSITLQIGRTGQITPVAELEPVKLRGSTISRATLHNPSNIKEKDIREGDTVVIEKAGEVIPVVVEVVKEKRIGNEEIFQFPTTCPSCGSTLQSRDSLELACVNAKCPAQNLEKVKYWCSRSAMDIYGGSGILIEKLFENKLIKDVADLYTLTIEQVSPLLKTPESPKKEKVVQDCFLPGLEPEEEPEPEKVFSKEAQKFLESVRRSKANPFKQVLVGLGINNVGSRATRLLVERYNSIKELAAAAEEELVQIPGIGKTTVQSLHDWCGNPENMEMIGRLKELGLNC